MTAFVNVSSLGNTVTVERTLNLDELGFLPLVHYVQLHHLRQVAATPGATGLLLLKLEIIPPTLQSS